MNCMSSTHFYASLWHNNYSRTINKTIETSHCRILFSGFEITAGQQTMSVDNIIKTWPDKCNKSTAVFYGPYTLIDHKMTSKNVQNSSFGHFMASFYGL